MKNVPTYYAKTLIIARIAATIIPTPIDFNNLIIFMRGFKSPESALLLRMFVYMSLVLFHKEKQKVINKSKQ